MTAGPLQGDKQKAQTNQTAELLCPLCGADAILRYPNHPGYQKPKVYDICQCVGCQASYALPMVVDDQLYELIYSKRDKIPGYSRYSRYAEEILTKDDPLRYLAESEDVFWSIRQYFDSRNDAKELSVLEVGSGLGYLTFALQKHGLNIHGADISAVAVAEARRRYGDLYVCGDISSLQRESSLRYDVILLTEVIEHIANVRKFLDVIVGLLREGGEIVLTTPNRSAYPDEVLWKTDLPPVHLWWFSEKSMEMLAEQLGLKCTFLDFTEYNQHHFRNLQFTGPAYVPTGSSTLDEFGRVCIGAQPPSRSRHMKDSIRRWIAASALKKLWHSVEMARIQASLRREVNDPRRRSVMCAILSK